LKNPKNLKYKEIEVFLLKNGFSFERGKWSHKIITSDKTWLHDTIPIHNWDCKNAYKKKLLKFYLDNK
jgi:predicted RNA binding protein YcfA (HicA-like mRNA interferase family)